MLTERFGQVNIRKKKKWGGRGGGCYLKRSHKGKHGRRGWEMF